MIDGLNERLQTFLECKTYTFIFDIFQYHFNGYVKEIKDNKFLFDDDKLGEIWINKNDVKNISFSNKKGVEE